MATAVGQARFKYCDGDFGCDFRCSFLVYFNYIPTFLNYSAISSLQKDLATIIVMLIGNMSIIQAKY
jgi:hypothetical protein